MPSTFSADDSSIVQYISGTWTPADAGHGASYLTRDPNATVSFSFDGTLIIVLGAIQPQQQLSQHPPLSYTLDGTEDPTFLFDSSSSDTATLYASPNLPRGPHTLTMRLVDDASTLVVFGGNVSSTSTTTSAPPPPPPLSHRTIIATAATIGALTLLLFLALALFLFIRRKRRCVSSPYALGPLQATLPSSKEAFTSPKYSNYGLSFSQSTESLGLGLPVPRSNLEAPVETVRGGEGVRRDGRCGKKEKLASGLAGLATPTEPAVHAQTQPLGLGLPPPRLAIPNAPPPAPSVPAAACERGRSQSHGRCKKKPKSGLSTLAQPGS